MIFKRRRKGGYFAKRFSVQLADRPPRFTWWQRLLLILIVILAGGFLWWIFLSGSFTVRSVQIEGLVSVPQSIVEEKLDIVGQNILLLNVAANEDRVRSLLSLRDVAIIRVLPNTIRVVVREREPVLVWESTNQLYLVDRTGLPYREVTEIPTGLFKVVDTANIHVDVGSQLVPSSFIATYATILPELVTVYGETISHFEIGETVYDLDVLLQDGRRVKLNILSSVGNQLKELSRLKEQRTDLWQRSVIDLRVDRWAYIR